MSYTMSENVLVRCCDGWHEPCAPVFNDAACAGVLRHGQRRLKAIKRRGRLLSLLVQTGKDGRELFDLLRRKSDLYVANDVPAVYGKEHRQTVHAKDREGGTLIE